MDATMTGSMTDEARLEAAADELTQILNAGCLSLMLSLGDRAGLFSTLATTGAVTSDGLATAAGLDERYVREWLGAMTVGRIVEHDPERAIVLARRRRTRHCSPTSGVRRTTRRVDPVRVGAGRSGGRAARRASATAVGCRTAAYPRFQEVMAEDSGRRCSAALQPTILPLVPGLTERSESGIDVAGRGLRPRPGSCCSSRSAFPLEPLHRPRPLDGGDRNGDCARRRRRACRTSSSWSPTRPGSVGVAARERTT